MAVDYVTEPPSALNPMTRRLRRDLECLQIYVKRGTLAELGRHAAKRKTTVSILASVCVETITADNLFDAVIDDKK